MTRSELQDRYLAGETITYRCIGREGGMILSRYNSLRGMVEYRHQNDATWTREARDRYLAAARVPTDARLAA